MQSMRDIKRQINSVENTKKITRAMKMVASAKLKGAQNRAEDAKPFFNTTCKTLQNALSRVNEDLHPLLEQKDEVDKVGYIVITGDRGLCGPYNTQIIRKVEEELETADYISSPDDAGMIAIGKKAKSFFDRNELEVFSEYLDLDDEPGPRLAEEIAKEASDLYQDGDLDRVYLIYTQFNSVINHEVKQMQLLPVETDDLCEEETESEYIYEPSASEVLDVVLPKYLRNVIFGALLEAKASEFAARMTAMDSATDNAEEMIGELTRTFNRARQAEITQEISEIAAGAEALD
ncbi:MAG: ATP synthase F1 subunit gamma [Bacillota bacterium]